MGHIELAAPVAHIWYFRGIPNRIALMLDVSPKAIERVVYFAAYIVIDKGTSKLEKGTVLTEKEYSEAVEKYGEDSFKAEMGAEALQADPYPVYCCLVPGGLWQQPLQRVLQP